MMLDPRVEPVLDALFQRLYATRDRSFANGRTVRNLFETALQNQAGRVADLVSAGNVSAEVLTVINADDITSLSAGGRQ